MRKLQELMPAVCFATGLLVAASMLAQVPQGVPAPELVPAEVASSDTAAPDAYGTSATTVVKIHAPLFRSQFTSDVIVAFWDTGISYRQSGDTIHMLHAPVELPAGALVTQIGFDGYDVDPVLNINWGLYWVSIDKADDTGYLGWYASNQSAGAFNSTATLGVPQTVDPGRYYFALVELPKLGQDVRIKGMRIGYKLQVSPAPGTATFTDVPTNYWAFQYIEALAASGITAGCGGGNFCPETTVTRAQMAVFLAKALGLHWPN